MATTHFFQVLFKLAQVLFKLCGSYFLPNVNRHCNSYSTDTEIISKCLSTLFMRFHENLFYISQEST